MDVDSTCELSLSGEIVRLVRLSTRLKGRLEDASRAVHGVSVQRSIVAIEQLQAAFRDELDGGDGSYKVCRAWPKWCASIPDQRAHHFGHVACYHQIR